jgi:hypothetical protein
VFAVCRPTALRHRPGIAALLTSAAPLPKNTFKISNSTAFLRQVRPRPELKFRVPGATTLQFEMYTGIPQAFEHTTYSAIKGEITKFNSSPSGEIRAAVALRLRRPRHANCSMLEAIAVCERRTGRPMNWAPWCPRCV